MAMHVQSAGRSDIGKVRRRNEDAILVGDAVGLWAVADGLGGHAAGDFASGLVVERLGGLPRDGNVFDFIDSIDDALAAVNDELRGEARERGVDLIASTVVLLVDADDVTLCGWLGDSRAYCCRDSGSVQLTRDHVHVGVNADVPPAGSGVLTHAVGAETALVLDWVVVAKPVGAMFVLCSDGLNKELTDAEIAASCRGSASPTAVLDRMFALALGRTARDNISAVLIRLPGDTGAQPRAMDVNAGLAALGAACRDGSIGLAEYRVRRRQLLGGLQLSAAPLHRAGPWWTGWSRWFSTHRGRHRR